MEPYYLMGPILQPPINSRAFVHRNEPWHDMVYRKGMRRHLGSVQKANLDSDDNHTSSGISTLKMEASMICLSYKFPPNRLFYGGLLPIIR